MPIPNRKQNETSDEFIQRCMSDDVMVNEYENESQRFAVCSMKLAKTRISFDYDGTLSTSKGKEIAQKLIKEGYDIVILTARNSNEDNNDIKSTAKELGIKDIYYTNGKDKWSFVKKYHISIHYDNNKEQIDKINSKTNTIGKLWESINT